MYIEQRRIDTNVLHFLSRDQSLRDGTSVFTFYVGRKSLSTRSRIKLNRRTYFHPFEMDNVRKARSTFSIYFTSSGSTFFFEGKKNANGFWG